MRRVLRSLLLWALQPPPVEYAPTSLKAHSPSRTYKGDAGFDLWTIEDVEIPPGGFVDVHTGIHIKMPEGVWARITNRSSTFRTWHLQVIEGIIDQGYTGELFVGVTNPNGSPIAIPEGTRIAQLIFHSLLSPVSWEFNLVENVDMPSDERGSRGFGSTGQ